MKNWAHWIWEVTIVISQQFCTRARWALTKIWEAVKTVQQTYERLYSKKCNMSVNKDMRGKTRIYNKLMRGCIAKSATGQLIIDAIPRVMASTPSIRRLRRGWKVKERRRCLCLYMNNEKVDYDEGEARKDYDEVERKSRTRRRERGSRGRGGGGGGSLRSRADSAFQWVEEGVSAVGPRRRPGKELPLHHFKVKVVDKQVSLFLWQPSYRGLKWKQPRIPEISFGCNWN